MIYVSLTTIPERIKNIEKSINSIISQTLKPDKIVLNIPYKYERFNNVISDDYKTHWTAKYWLLDVA